MTTAHLKIRAALLSDLPRLTEIHNHYVLNTHIVFELRPYTVEQRVPWFHEHNDGRRYDDRERLDQFLCATDRKIIGYAAERAA